MLLLGQLLTNPQPIRLKATENDFSIEFVGLSYVNPRNSLYAGFFPGSPVQRDLEDI